MIESVRKLGAHIKTLSSIIGVVLVFSIATGFGDDRIEKVQAMISAIEPMLPPDFERKERPISISEHGATMEVSVEYRVEPKRLTSEKLPEEITLLYISDDQTSVQSTYVFRFMR